MPIRITGLNSGLDTESIISALVSSYNYKTEKYKKAQTKLSWKQDAWKSLNTKIYSLYKSVGNMRFSSAYSMKTASVSDSSKISVTAGNGAVNGSYSVKVKALATAGYLTGGRIGKKDDSGKVTEFATANTTLAELGYTGADTKITVNGKEIKVTKDTKLSEVVNQMQQAGINASYDEKNGRIFLSAKKTGAGSDVDITAEDNKVLEALGLAANTPDAILNNNKGTDAVIELNGAEFTSSTNTFAINGMTINAMAVTTDAVNVSVGVDAQGIYDKIKDFFSQYNSLINEMTKLYNADSAKGYEPLTDEEKDSMSDTEVEKWEEKIKDSLLRRDDTLSGVISVMTQAMSQGVEIDGKKVYLSDFGIKTMGVLNAAKNEHNAYHIDGDEDDANTSGKTDKLMAAIAEDPDKVIEFMQGMSKNLYEAVDKKMKSTSLSSIYTVYNDKEMASEYSDYTSLIAKWEEKLKAQEEYYYKKFAAMETALSKLNSQTSSLSGLFGGM